VVCVLPFRDIHGVQVSLLARPTVHVPGCVSTFSTVWVHAVVPCWGFASLLQPDASALLARQLPLGPDWCAAAAGVVSSLPT
jgi:hypothetical protein